MDYSNPKLPEGINASREHPLREFTLLLGGIALVIVTTLAILYVAADWLAGKIPFALERQAVASVRAVLPEPRPEAVPLQALADRIVAVTELAPEIVVDVHVVDRDEVNAFATLGGQVVVTAGMLHALSSENAVAMVLAHEIGHVARRHPVRALGRVTVLVAGLAALAGAGSDQLAGGIVSDAGGLTLLGFSRAQELEADAFALEAVHRLYGHTAGALQLYRDLLPGAGDAEAAVPALLSTHPLTAERIEAMETLAREQGWPSTGMLTPGGP